MKNAAAFDKRMASEQETDTNHVWYDVPNTAMTISGLGFFETEQRWQRLPVGLQEEIRLQRPALEELSGHMAGVSVNFITDSLEIWLRAEVNSPPYMSHMTPAAQCGFDCYIRLPNEEAWLLAGVTKYHPSQKSFCCRLAQNLPSGTQVRIYFPLYIGIKTVQVGLCRGSRIAPPKPYINEKAVAFYGTSITQGGCATHPGMAYPAILERILDIPVYNLGFSGNGVGNMAMAEVVCSLPNLGALVIDIEANAGPEHLLEENLPMFLNRVREKMPTLPVLILSGTPQPAAVWDAQLKKQLEHDRAFEQREVAKRREAGDQHLFFADPTAWIGACGTEATVDGIHLTDLGFYLMAQGLTPLLKNILNIKR